MADFIVGNDISQFQNQAGLDWNTYKNNTKFVIIRSTYGNGYYDSYFAFNRDQARSLNLPRGYYHYSYPQYNTAHDEAMWFCNALHDIQEGEVLALDFEEKYTGDVVQWCHDFLDTVFHTLGVKPLIYLNQSQTKGYNWQPIVDAGYGLWLASYTYDPTVNTGNNGAWPFMAMQQWTSSQNVPGINGNVDGDVFFGTVDQFKAYGFKPVQAPTPPAPVPPPPNPTPSPVPPPPTPITPSLKDLHDVIYAKWQANPGSGYWVDRLHQLKKLFEVGHL